MHASPQWEYRDFVHSFPAGRIWVNLGRLDQADILTDLSLKTKPPDETRRGLTFEEARTLFWREYKPEIEAAIQQWIADGWEPGDEIGPSGITLHTYKSFKTNPALRPLFIVFSILMLGLPLFWRDTVAEPAEFRLLMRRPATHDPT